MSKSKKSIVSTVLYIIVVFLLVAVVAGVLFGVENFLPSKSSTVVFTKNDEVLKDGDEFQLRGGIPVEIACKSVGDSAPVKQFEVKVYANPEVRDFYFYHGDEGAYFSAQGDLTGGFDVETQNNNVRVSFQNGMIGILSRFFSGQEIRIDEKLFAEETYFLLTITVDGAKKQFPFSVSQSVTELNVDSSDLVFYE